MGRSVCTRVAMTGVGGCLRAAKEDTRESDPKEWAMTTWMARSGEDSCRRWPPNMHWPTRIQPAHVCEWFPCLVVPALNHHGRSPPAHLYPSTSAISSSNSCVRSYFAPSRLLTTSPASSTMAALPPAPILS